MQDDASVGMGGGRVLDRGLGTVVHAEQNGSADSVRVGHGHGVRRRRSALRSLAVRVLTRAVLRVRWAGRVKVRTVATSGPR